MQNVFNTDKSRDNKRTFIIETANLKANNKLRKPWPPNNRPPQVEKWQTIKMDTHRSATQESVCLSLTPLSRDTKPIVQTDSFKTFDVGADQNSDDDDNILNIKVTMKERISAMEKSRQFLSKYKTIKHIDMILTPNTSWLIHTVSSIITNIDKIKKPHKYIFETQGMQQN